ncbi:MAG: ion channel [Pseudomonadota bacterium]|nr:ion channel [Pseudomonadota bacterium]
MSTGKPRSRSPISGQLGDKEHGLVSVRRVRIGQREIITRGISRAVFQDLFHYFMTVSWPQLFATFAAFFLAFDTIFGFIYYLVPGCIANLSPPGFAGAFFFSVETLATVGYGDMHPQTLYGHSVAMIEIFVGLMSLAVITGIMFARFSRPRARFIFTKNLVVRPLDGRLTLLIRAANLRQNVVQDASAHLYMLRDEVTQEGFRIRRVIDLPLVRSQHPMFMLGWTMMHWIDESSALNLETSESLEKSNAAFVLSMSGTDETTSQTLTARANYSHADIRWDATFRDILEEAPDGTLHLDYTKFNEVDSLSGAKSDVRTELAPR